MDNEMIVLKWLFPVFLAALAVVHLISCWRGDDDLRKPTKVALMPVVALTYLAFANTPSLWVVAGLLFGCLGDLFLLRPLSGSASLAVLKTILADYGPDSPIGLTASVMMGSSETVFYTCAVYLGAAGVKKSRHAIPCALIAWLAGGAAAALWYR